MLPACSVIGSSPASFEHGTRQASDVPGALHDPTLEPGLCLPKGGSPDGGMARPTEGDPASLELGDLGQVGSLICKMGIIIGKSYIHKGLLILLGT